MREITTTDLCAMEVINLCDGGRLGYPSALELCPEDGKITAIDLVQYTETGNITVVAKERIPAQITALIIPRECGFLGLGKTERYRIPWCRIECIGEDAILVKLTAAELTNCLVGGKGKRK